MKRSGWLYDALWALPLVIVLGWTVHVVLNVETPTIPSMRTVDIFDTTLTTGLRQIIASVETNVLDSELVAQYVTMLYHRLVPTHLDDTALVRMEVYVYDPEMRRELSPDVVLVLTRNNPRLANVLGELQFVDTAYIAMRLSSVWMILGHDTLIVNKSPIVIPREHVRWASLVRRLEL